MKRSVSAVILAAGASRRIGFPKALLEYKGELFVNRLKRMLAEFCQPVVVVGSSQSTFPVGVVNPAPERGMLSSLQCGLRALPGPPDAVLFTLVDLPGVTVDTLRTLVEGWHGEKVRIPRFEGRCGHPVMFSASLIPEFLDASGTPKDVILRYASETVHVDVDDAGVVTDVDTPDDYKNLERALTARSR